MAVFCPKCGKKTYDEYKCDHCQYQIKEKPATKYKWQKPNNQLNKNNLIIFIMIGIITISLGYIAFNKLRERRENEKALKYLTGYDNPEKLMDATPKEKMKKMEKSKAMQDLKYQMKENFKETEKLMNNFKLIDLPIKTNENYNNEYFKYMNKNNELKNELRYRHIDYKTIINQKMYKYRNLSIKEKEKKEFEILKELIKK